MSGLILPHLPGQKFTSKKSPLFSTKPQKALSGKESRISFRAYPLYQWELEYEFLSDNFSQAPSRTNYVPYSQDATQWSAANGGTGLAPIVVGNYALATDGTLTADRVILNKGSGTTTGDFSNLTTATSSLTSGSTYTSSVWLKTNNGGTVVIGLQVTSAGIAGIPLVTVTPQWQRLSVTFASLGGTGVVGLWLVGTLGTANYADLSVWSAQTEPGQYATLPHIMTNGSAIRIGDLKSVFGMFSQMLGQYDTFLYSDPDFNTVQLQQFATGNGSTVAFNLTAIYKPGAEIVEYGDPAPVLGIAGVPEWVQNTNGPPQIYTARYGVPELLSAGLRTNLLHQSQTLTTGWGTHNATATTGAGVAPDNTGTANLLTEDNTNNQHYIIQTLATSQSAGQIYSYSIFVRGNGRPQVVLEISDGTNAVLVLFDTIAITSTLMSTTGTGQYVSSAVENCLGSGWFRCTVTFQVVTAATYAVFVSLYGGALVYLGNGTAGAYLWGGQFETGAYQTAYIPTTTTSATNGGSDYSLTNLTIAGAVNTFQQVQFVTAPGNTAPLLWSGSFFYRCRFSDDSLDFEEMMKNIWALKKLSFEQILL